MIGDYRFVPQRAYDVILYLNKNQRPLRTVQPDLISIPMLKERRHAAEKPVDLYQNLLSRSCTAGEMVLDPFCGAGPIFPAANRLGLFAVGIEKNPDLANHSIGRFEEK